jgi:hypothetical protein
VRCLTAVFGAGLIALLAVAVCIVPSPKGYGTHTQIGLGSWKLQQCSFKQLVGVRCPSCGMTTSWAHFVRGHWLQAVQANSGGALLALVASIAGPWLLASGVLGNWFLGRPNEWLVVAIAAAVVVLTLIDWTIRLSLWLL